MCRREHSIIFFSATIEDTEQAVTSVVVRVAAVTLLTRQERQRCGTMHTTQQTLPNLISTGVSVRPLVKAERIGHGQVPVRGYGKPEMHTISPAAPLSSRLA